MGFKLSLTPESVEALRNWADSIPFAIQNIKEETEKLLSNCNSQDGLGVHRTEFVQMLLSIKKVEANLLESAELLPKMLNNTADKIEQYIYNIPDYAGGGNNGDSGVTQRVRKR